MSIDGFTGWFNVVATPKEGGDAAYSVQFNVPTGEVVVIGCRNREAAECIATVFQNLADSASITKGPSP